jgi:hypothetical protein
VAHPASARGCQHQDGGCGSDLGHRFSLVGGTPGW